MTVQDVHNEAEETAKDAALFVPLSAKLRKYPPGTILTHPKRNLESALRRIVARGLRAAQYLKQIEGKVQG